MAKQKIFCNIVLIVIIVLSVCGCIEDEESSFDIDDTVVEAKYLGKNDYNDSIVKIIRVENSPKAEDIYALIKAPNGSFIDWHAHGENPGNRHPISAITHIGISKCASDREDISWNDNKEDHRIQPDENFYISKNVVPGNSYGYKFILEYKNGEVLLEVDLD
ncbi:MAG: hypothetical protein KAJ51_05890 [Thermoplasmata archaeon]|nr:hypothetical protein [Thermoplasmata archaeon]